MHRLLLLCVVAILLQSCGSETGSESSPISSSDPVTENEEQSYDILKEQYSGVFENGKPLSLLAELIDKDKNSLNEIVAWYDAYLVYVNNNKASQPDKVEQIRRGIYETVYTKHLDEIEGCDAAFNFTKSLPVDSIKFTGEMKNFEITEAQLIIEKSCDIVVLGFDLSGVAKDFAAKSGREDKSYYGPTASLKVKFKTTDKYYFDEKKHNDVRVAFVLRLPEKHSATIPFVWDLEGSNINRKFMFGPSETIREMTFECPLWDYKVWNSRSKNWEEDLPKLIKLGLLLSKMELAEVRVDPFSNSGFDQNGIRR